MSFTDTIQGKSLNLTMGLSAWSSFQSSSYSHALWVTLYNYIQKYGIKFRTVYLDVESSWSS